MIGKLSKGVMALLVLAFAFGVTSQTVFAEPSKGNIDKMLIAKRDGGNTLHWYKEFQPALKAARDAKKWVLIDFYTDW